MSGGQPAEKKSISGSSYSTLAKLCFNLCTIAAAACTSAKIQAKKRLILGQRLK
jgi:hypothetical protein